MSNASTDERKLGLLIKSCVAIYMTPDTRWLLRPVKYFLVPDSPLNGPDYKHW